MNLPLQMIIDELEMILGVGRVYVNLAVVVQDIVEPVPTDDY
ncbi:hypothetical protein VB834_24380 [Limnoraphis robusta Tam1]|uniref:Uncharacterized protein n=1 Tax=Limnoraphis robusta CCNP1315 TaxID=3110306 RepID=A0ABU5U284_9CYAN|nr:hypothetical protein [Limnoraphis robusta]MEA5520758.1 hypothetical protein [Limnoraphis robusta CCNP1315]MEA5542175.1 hypothetical protein [Limnoraphis robusta Tam1]MEA5546627.1 hypothetical protein [Limnoraphis robusta CCNP1324]